MRAYVGCIYFSPRRGDYREPELAGLAWKATPKSLLSERKGARSEMEIAVASLFSKILKILIVS